MNKLTLSILSVLLMSAPVLAQARTTILDCGKSSGMNLAHFTIKKVYNQGFPGAPGSLLFSSDIELADSNDSANAEFKDLSVTNVEQNNPYYEFSSDGKSISLSDAGPGIFGHSKGFNVKIEIPSSDDVSPPLSVEGNLNAARTSFSGKINFAGMWSNKVKLNCTYQIQD